MLPLVGDLNWFKDVVLPILLTFACSWMLSHVKRFTVNRRSKAAIKQADQAISWTSMIVTADQAGGFYVFALIKSTHLLVRCTTFLFAFTAMIGLYIIASISKNDTDYYPVVLMGLLAGVLLNMVRTVWFDIHDMAKAYVEPRKHVQRLIDNFNPALKEQYSERLKGLMVMAERMEQQRHGRMVAELLAGGIAAAGKTEHATPME